MSNSILSAQVRAVTWTNSLVERVRSSEKGQGATEYAGVVIVSIIIVFAIITAVRQLNIGTTLTGKIKELLNEKTKWGRRECFLSPLTQFH